MEKVNFREIFSLIVLSVFIQPLPAFSQNETTSTTHINDKKQDEPSTKFNLTFETYSKLQAVTQEDGSRSQIIEYTLTPEIDFKSYKIAAEILYSQDLLESKKNEVDDPSVTVTKAPWKFDYFSIEPSVSLTLPATKKSKEVVGLKYNAGAAASVALNTKQLGWDSTKLSYSLALNRNVTEFDTNSKGEPNNEYRIRQRINFGYKLFGDLSFKTRFQFDSIYSTEGSVKNAFLHYQSLVYGVTKNFSVAAGHSNGNSLFHKDTFESNMKFFDNETSEYFFGFEFNI